MISKFPGKCKTCSGPYKAGEEIYWTREDGAHHINCFTKKDLFSDSEALETANRCGFFPAKDLDPKEVNR